MADPAIAAAEPEHRQPFRTMFVTIGSIASFKSLVTEVLSDNFLETLAKLKFNRLVVQCGPDLELFERIRPQRGFESHWIDIVGFAYTNKMKSYMLECAPSPVVSTGVARGRGIIMAHAGAGTILEALDIDARVIVVANTSLMDNHQLELAEELEKQGYLLQGHLGALHEDVERMEAFEPVNWPPKPPQDSKYRHLGEMVQPFFPNVRHVSQASEEEARKMPLEKQMWRDLLAKPVPEDDPRRFFLNGQNTKEKEAMFHEWRNNWYDKKRQAGEIPSEEPKTESG